MQHIPVYAAVSKLHSYPIPCSKKKKAVTTGRLPTAGRATEVRYREDSARSSVRPEEVNVAHLLT